MSSEKTDGQVLKGLLDTLVLGVLAEEDDYGFGILQKLAERAGDSLALKEATLYPLLHRMESRGFLECYWRPGQRGTDRKYYRITDDGHAHLSERLVEWKKVASILETVVLERRRPENVKKGRK